MLTEYCGHMKTPNPNLGNKGVRCKESSNLFEWLDWPLTKVCLQANGTPTIYPRKPKTSTIWIQLNHENLFRRRCITLPGRLSHPKMCNSQWLMIYPFSTSSWDAHGFIAWRSFPLHIIRLWVILPRTNKLIFLAVNWLCASAIK